MAAVIAVRGKIFYVNCYDNSTRCTCTCNGTVDLNMNGNCLKQVAATRHEPYLTCEPREKLSLNRRK